ncbi:MAG: multidrug ABC transporter permease, partial [Candidatus Izimaplasma sp.]|nr:multidrug ABC transporter permease [Candidatus Izimaplasma bacterium]
NTEKSIQRAIKIVLKGRTSFVIAHRLSTITSSDRILLLENGIIKESGTHHELIQLEQKYYKLYTNQFKSRVIFNSKNG